MFCEVNSKCGGGGDGGGDSDAGVSGGFFYKNMLLVDQAAAVVVVKNNFEVPNALQHWQSRLIERRRKIFLKGRSCWIT